MTVVFVFGVLQLIACAPGSQKWTSLSLSLHALCYSSIVCHVNTGCIIVKGLQYVLLNISPDFSPQTRSTLCACDVDLNCFHTVPIDIFYGQPRNKYNTYSKRIRYTWANVFCYCIFPNYLVVTNCPIIKEKATTYTFCRLKNRVK